MDHAVACPVVPPRRSVLKLVLAALALRRSRLRLRDLDAHLLRDIGLSPAEAACEAQRPAWDAPDHWLR